MKNEKLTEYELKLANEIKRALLKNKRRKLLVYVHHVAPSGMSRTLRFTFIDSYGDPINADYIISKVAGETRTHDGVRVKGCGMDMIFATLNCFLIGMGVKNSESFKYASNYTMI